MNEREKMFRPMIVTGLVITAFNIYWFGYEFFQDVGLVWEPSNELLRKLSSSGMFDNQYKLKLIALVSLFFGSISRRGKYSYEDWKDIIIYTVISLCVFFFPYFNPLIYIITTTVGVILSAIALGKIGNKLGGMKNPISSPYETFEQGTDKPIITEYSVNFKIRYMVNRKWKTGWLNVVNPFRGNMIFGLPGSGKSYSIVNEYIWQCIHKGFSAFVYDFKKFELSTFTYNCYLRSRDVFKEKYGVEPYFCFIYMADPRYSMRCNPLNRKYINDMSAAIQKAKIIRKNRMDPNKDTGFFADNAETLWVAAIWALRLIDNGRYCTLPHFVELMLSPQEKLMALLSKIPDCYTLVRDIIKAGAEGANEQAQGIYASATTPLKELRTERTYWIFGANQVDLRINKKERPTILVVGNDPEKKDAFATGIALITSELYLQVNDKGRVPCMLCQDEYPTMKPEGFDNIVATGRSNYLAAVAAAQDMDQMIRDLKKENASAFLSIISNQFFGQMTGSHKREVSDMFGQHKVRQESETTGGSSDTLNTSFHLEKRLPEDKIATMSQGTFAAIVADGRGEEKLDSKLFCAEIVIDESLRPNKKDGKWEEMPMFAEDQFYQESTRKKILADPETYCKKYLFDEMMEEEQDKISNDPHANVRSEYVIKEEVLSKYESLNEKEKRDLLKITIEKALEDKTMEVMRSYMKSVEDDILVIFNNYEIYDNPMKGAGEKPKTGKPLNGGERPIVGAPEDMKDLNDNFFKGSKGSK